SDQGDGGCGDGDADRNTRVLMAGLQRISDCDSARDGRNPSHRDRTHLLHDAADAVGLVEIRRLGEEAKKHHRGDRGDSELVVPLDPAYPDPKDEAADDDSGVRKSLEDLQLVIVCANQAVLGHWIAVTLPIRAAAGAAVADGV